MMIHRVFFGSGREETRLDALSLMARSHYLQLLLIAGNTVVVNGKITLFYRFSQYQIKVSNIQGAGAPGAKVNVTKITNQISDLVAETPELQNIRIQGEVLEVFSAAVSNWDLCDVGGPPELQIKCVHRGPIGALVQKRE